MLRFSRDENYISRRCRFKEEFAGGHLLGGGGGIVCRNLPTILQMESDDRKIHCVYRLHIIQSSVTLSYSLLKHTLQMVSSYCNHEGEEPKWCGNEKKI